MAFVIGVILEGGPRMKCGKVIEEQYLSYADVDGHLEFWTSDDRVNDI